MGSASSSPSVSLFSNSSCTTDVSVAAQPERSDAAATTHGEAQSGAEAPPLPNIIVATPNVEAAANSPSLEDGESPILTDPLTTLDDSALAQNAALGNRAPMMVAMAQFPTSFHFDSAAGMAATAATPTSRCSREDQLDCSKSRSSQLRVSFTVAVRFDDDDTQVSDDDSCESTARSLSTMLLSSGPLSPQTAPAGAAAVGAEPTAFGAAAVVVPLIRDDVKHRHQQAVPRAARSRNNRIREITARHRPSPFPERPESRPPGINCNMAQNSLAVSNLLPDNSFL